MAIAVNPEKPGLIVMKFFSLTGIFIVTPKRWVRRARISEAPPGKSKYHLPAKSTKKFLHITISPLPFKGKTEMGIEVFATA